MATISSTGLGSGIDIDGIVSKLMAAERAPLQAMQTRQAKIEARISAYGSIKSAVSTFRDAMNGLNSLDKYQAKKVAVSDDTIAKVAASKNAVPGSYELQVKQLAQGQKLATTAFASDTDVLGTGNIVIEFGSYKDGTGFTPNAKKPAQTIAIGTGQSSLTGIRDAINKAKIGVSASLLNDGTGYRLVIKSDDAGTENSLKISVNGDSDGDNANAGGLSYLAFDPANPPPTLQPGDVDHGLARQVAAAKDAQLVVDGIDVTSSKNVVTDVIQGVTMNLTKTTETNLPITVDVAQDKDKIKEAINNFAKTYNDLRTVIKDLTAYDPATKQGAVLQGDYLARSMVNNISRALTSTIDGLTGGYSFLSEIGITSQRDGTLTVNDSKLTAAIEQHPDDVAALFSEIGRASDGLVQYNSATATTIPGTYDVSINQLGTRAEMTTATIGALANTNGTLTNAYQINAANNGLSVTVDGVASGAINLTQKDYTTMDELVAELQGKINSDTALSKAGKGVTVGYQGSALTFRSNLYGADSSLQIANTSLGASLGIAGTDTVGQDAQGSLGGKAATGKGQYLYGATGTDMDGLKVQVLGGAIGARGTVSFSQGYAYELGKLADDLLVDKIVDKKEIKGGLVTRADSLTKELERIKKREQDFEDRMTLVEKRLRGQFNAMDKMVGQLRSTSDYLSRQLR
jgi:flagellar hook-associated protein 2